jgi:hypothetical protein
MKPVLFAALFTVLLTAQEADTTAVTDTTAAVQDTLPPLRPETEAVTPLPLGKPFYQYEANLDHLQAQLDSLKQVIKVYEKERIMPRINEQLLELIQMPEFRHRIVLQNGTIILGEIVSESADQLIVKTSIGKLVIDREHVARVDEELPEQAQVELVGEPYVQVYPDREVITGIVKNVGRKRADFVRVVALLWSHTTELAATDSAFVDGKEAKYETGVITDTALEPGATAAFKIVVPLPAPDVTAYRTYAVHWTETR